MRPGGSSAHAEIQEGPCSDLDLRAGGNRYFVAKGKSAGGQFRTIGKGPFFVWPSDLNLSIGSEVRTDALALVQPGVRFMG
jgi:hypothetical protein